MKKEQNQKMKKAPIAKKTIEKTKHHGFESELKNHKPNFKNLFCFSAASKSGGHGGRVLSGGTPEDVDCRRGERLD